MYKILLIDDDIVFLNKAKKSIEDCIEKNKVSACVNSFSDYGKVGQHMLSSYDIAFLDIDFGHSAYTGLDIARKIRAVRQDAVIVFLTNYLEYAPEGYEVRAFRYLLKGDMSLKLEQYLLEALRQLDNQRQTLKIQRNGEIIDLPVENILYIESNQRMVQIAVRKKGANEIKIYNCYESISRMEEKLTPLGFLRVHKSYLVNMRKIKKYQCHVVLLDGGITVKASERRYAQMKKQYLLWKGV